MKTILLFILMIINAAFASPCGIQGAIEERIKECGMTKGNFALVARDEKGVEVYKDLKSGLIWGNRIGSDFNHYGSQKACPGENPESSLLKDLKWRLPTVREFEESASHGMKSTLPNMNYWFWTSTPVQKAKKSKRRRSAAPAQVYLWDGLEEVSDVGDLKDGASVRCVATAQ